MAIRDNSKPALKRRVALQGAGYIPRWQKGGKKVANNLPDHVIKTNARSVAHTPNGLISIIPLEAVVYDVVQAVWAEDLS